jgi:UDP-2,3-diacylglucosamine hydrolase
MTKTDSVLCISDLHLSAERPDIFEAFRSFLNNQAKSASDLFILGDFFNLWIGDDDPDTFSAQVAKELAVLADSGTNIYIMHGNRDFLLGEKFCQACHASLIHEPYILSCFEQEYLLMHGDSLCTRDDDYMAFRAMVRNPQWQSDFLSRPLPERQAFANEARTKSKSMSSNKAEDIMDVSPEDVINLLSDHQQKILIHGHTHRPDIHELSLSGTPGLRIVLGDWDKKGWYLKITPEGHTLQDFTI